jgi:hypothetical protein
MPSANFQSSFSGITIDSGTVNSIMLKIDLCCSRCEQKTYVPKAIAANSDVTGIIVSSLNRVRDLSNQVLTTPPWINASIYTLCLATSFLKIIISQSTTAKNYDEFSQFLNSALQLQSLALLCTTIYQSVQQQLYALPRHLLYIPPLAPRLRPRRLV